jgi:hypothetical protein
VVTNLFLTLDTKRGRKIDIWCKKRHRKWKGRETAWRAKTTDFYQNGINPSQNMYFTFSG